MSGLPEQPKLVRSKQCIADHGEVFAPAWMVEDMLDLVKNETERIDFRYDSLTERAFSQGTQFAQFEEHEIFTPTKSYQPMTVEEIAA